MYDLVKDDPVLAWLSIKAVVNRYTTAQLMEKGLSVVQRVAANLAAGPFEDLLARPGVTFIDEVEEESHRDVRIRWLLGAFGGTG